LISLIKAKRPFRLFLKTLVILGGLNFFLLLSACDNPKTVSLRFGLASAPITLDPRFATDAASSRINRLLYKRLIEFNDDRFPVPGMAHWEKISPTHYRFTLKKNISPFHDGAPVTSADVKWTLNYILDTKNVSPHRASLSMIERMETPDSRTIVFFLKRPDPLFPGRLSMGILPKDKIKGQHPFNRLPVGNGPFSFVSWPEDGLIRVSRNLDGQVIEFVHIPDPTVRVLKLIKGEIDMLQNDFPPELISYISKKSNVKIIKGKGSNFTYLGFNMEDPLVGRLKVRQAIAYALNRHEIIQYVLGGAARPASSLLPPDHWAGHPDLPIIEYDPQKARLLLSEMGGNNKQIKLTYKTSSDPFRIRLATIIQNQLEKVGFDIDIRSFDWGTFYGDIKGGRFQMYSLSWVGIKSPDIFHMVFHSQSIPPDGANRGRFKSPVADRLIEAAQLTFDLTEQQGYYQDLQTHLLEQLPYVPLWYEDHIFVGRKNIGGYTVAIDGNYDGLNDIRIVQ